MKYTIAKNGKSWLLEEKVYIKADFPLVHHKHYLPMENTHLNIERK